MMPAGTTGFSLDPAIERDSLPIMWLGLCELRIQDDCRWPWLLLVPQRRGAEEFHDLTPLDQAMLTFEIGMVAKGLKEATACRKINIATLGNIVPQLHVHIVARDPGDAGWPGPVWGQGPREPWRREDLHGFAERIKTHL